MNYPLIEVKYRVVDSPKPSGKPVYRNGGFMYDRNNGFVRQLTDSLQSHVKEAVLGRFPILNVYKCECMHTMDGKLCYNGRIYYSIEYRNETGHLSTFKVYPSPDMG